MLLSNKPFFLFLVMFSFVGAGLGMWFSLVFIFVDGYLGLGHQFAWMYIVSLCISTLTLGVWSALAARWGKKITWGIAVSLISLGIASAGSLVPGESSFIFLLMIYTLVILGFAAYSILVPSMLADIIDYGTWKSGVEMGGTYFSVFTLMGKATMAIGGALGLFVAGGYGFDPAASTHTADAIFGLRLATAWLPASIVLLALIFVALTPINARRHAIIRRHLDARSSRAQAVEKQSLIQTSNDHSADTTVSSNSEIPLTSKLKT